MRSTASGAGEAGGCNSRLVLVMGGNCLLCSVGMALMNQPKLDLYACEWLLLAKDERPFAAVSCAVWHNLIDGLLNSATTGKFEVNKPGADRASKVEDTQKAASNAARQILGNDGGGELQIRGLDGKIRQQDTIKPGNDSRKSKG